MSSSKGLTSKEWRIVSKSKKFDEPYVEVSEPYSEREHAVHTLKNLRQTYPNMDFVLQIRETIVTIQELPWIDSEAEDAQ